VAGTGGGTLSADIFIVAPPKSGAFFCGARSLRSCGFTRRRWRRRCHRHQQHEHQHHDRNQQTLPSISAPFFPPD